MITLVTGATGHLGANLVRALLAQGHKVRAMVRKNSNPSALAGLDEAIVEGDLGDPASLERAVSGVTRMFHTAAMISIKSGDREKLMRINVDGTRALMEAALKAGVTKVVHTSSFGAIGTPHCAETGKTLCSTEEH